MHKINVYPQFKFSFDITRGLSSTIFLRKFLPAVKLKYIVFMYTSVCGCVVLGAAYSVQCITYTLLLNQIYGNDHLKSVWQL